MEKRLIVFFVIAAAILLSYNLWLAPKIEQKPVAGTPAGNQAAPNSPAAAINPAQPPADQPAAVAANVPTPVNTTPEKPVRQIKVITKLWTGTFVTKGAVANDWILKQLPQNYHFVGKSLKNHDGGDLKLFNIEPNSPLFPFQIDFPNDSDLTNRVKTAVFDVSTDVNEVMADDKPTTVLTFTYQDPSNVVVKKTFTFYPEKFDFRVAVEATRGNEHLPIRMIVGPSFGDPTQKGGSSYTNTPPQVTAVVNDSIKRETDLKTGKEQFNGAINWGAVSDHYFAFLLVPDKPESEILFSDANKIGAGDGKAFDPFLFNMSFNQGTVYIGPKDRDILGDLSVNLKATTGRPLDLEDVIDYGMFHWVVKPIVPIISWSLGFLFKLIHNYGWSIIAFTVIVNLFFFPLKWKSSVAMKKAQKMQPKMKALQEKMKGMKKDHPDYAKLQMEQVALMKEGNPLSGCLPMLIQMPIFWAIFIYLGISVYVRQSPWFGWIHDLSSPDPYYILPVIMCVSMIAQSALTPTPTDAQQKMQKYMMTWGMPVLFTVLFFVKAPSGLVIYWMFSNLMGVAQQVTINKLS